MSNVTNDLPIGWVSTRLGDLYSFEYGKSLIKGSRASAGKYPVYGSSGIVGMHDQFLIEGPAIIVGRKGAAGSVSYSTDNLWPIDTTYYVREDKNLCLKFSYYLFRSLNLAKLEASTAIPGLNRNHAYDENVLLPPLPEQNRIVAKIEELFSELDKGIENLKTAQAQLKVYRQALLKHAFEGKLTAQWRAENQDKLETADALLKRIQQARAQRYQQQLAGWQTNGGSKPKAPKPLPPLSAEELAELPELPEGWGWVRLGDLAIQITKGASPNWQGINYVNDPSQVLFVTSENVRENFIDISKPKYVEMAFNEKQPNTILKNGDLLVNIVGASIGRASLFNLNLCANVNQAVSVVRIPAVELRQYISLLLNTHFASIYFSKNAVDVARANLSLVDVANIPVPLCSLNEIAEIQSDVEARLSEVDQLDQTLTTSLQQAEALRQSILKKAFSGQLVPQDPHDEPASALLARIKAERETVAAKPRKTGKGKA